MRKRIIVMLLLVFLVGCTNKDKENSINNKQEMKKEENYIYIDENVAPITVNEAQNYLNQVLTSGELEKYLFDFIGLEIHENRMYYHIFMVLNTPEERRTVERYAIDVYTGEVYRIGGESWIKLE